MLQRNWVDATDLNSWANRLDSQSRLPQLLRRLIHATVRHIQRIGFPAGESVQLGGYDGVLQVLEGNAFVPDGFSVWEFGTNRAIKGKADADYNKRCNEPLAINPAETTFIFVTPRRWGNKDEWVEKRNAEGIWAEVRVYDADDLEQWLEIAPAVHSWLARLIGKFPEGALSLGDFWEEWRFSTSPPMSTELHLAGRNEATEKIKTWLTGTPSSLTVQADSREEVIAFFGAVIHQLPEEERETYLSRCVIAQEEQSWRQLMATQDPLILIPHFNNPVGLGNSVARQGHHVLIPIGKENTPSAQALQLARLARAGFETALANMGLSEERARSLTDKSKRSLLVLRRQLASNPEIHCPAWSQPEEAPALISILLLGAWDDSKEADRKAVEEISRKSYADVLRTLSRWVNESDPPVRKIGDIWQLVSRDDSWHLLSRFLLREDLEAFESVFLSTLGQLDPCYDLPIDQRFMAGIYGKVLPHSHWLRRGLVETLALIASRGNNIQDSMPPQNRVSAIVRELLTSDSAGKLWESLSSLLPILAETAPESFMDAVENALSEENPFLMNLFTDSDPMHSSPHTGLLWALEIFAWEPQYLCRVTLILGKLSRLDPGGKLVNRPFRSLGEIFLWWHPQTPASLEQRLKVIDTLLQREPDVAWNLICNLLPTEGGGASFPTQKPLWREWGADYNPSVTYAEVNQWADAIAERMLSNAGINADRWNVLLDQLGSFPLASRNTAVDHLFALSQGTDVDFSNRLNLWQFLRNLIHKNRRYINSKWALPTDITDRLCEIYQNFEPTDYIDRYAWLFCSRASLPNAVSEDWESNEKALNKFRVEATEQIFLEGGISKLIQLSKHVEHPMQLGSAIAQIQDASSIKYELLSLTLGEDNPSLIDLGIGFVAACYYIHKWEWVKTTLTTEISQKWSTQQHAGFLRGLPFSQETWEWLTTFGEETEKLYWEQVRILWSGKETAELVVRKLLEVGRPYGALNTAFLCLNENDDTLPISASLLVDLLESMLQGDPKTEVPTPDVSSLNYKIGKLFSALDISRIQTLNLYFM
jgi:hypothetical protein